MTGTRRAAAETRRRAAAETRRRAALVAAVAALTAGLAGGGCSSGASSGTAAAGVAAGGSCGAARTAAGVPVTIKVTRGTVNCATVLGVERSYAELIREGDVPGNGGGAPVRVGVGVGGWTCAGYPTPQVLRTGDASECHTATAEVVAVLAAPFSGT